MDLHISVLLKAVAEALGLDQLLNAWHPLKSNRDGDGRSFRFIGMPKQDPGSQSDSERISPVTFVSHRDDFLDEIGVCLFLCHLLCSSSHLSYTRFCWSFKGLTSMRLAVVL